MPETEHFNLLNTHSYVRYHLIEGHFPGMYSQFRAYSFTISFSCVLIRLSSLASVFPSSTRPHLRKAADSALLLICICLNLYTGRSITQEHKRVKYCGFHFISTNQHTCSISGRGVMYSRGSQSTFAN